MCVLLLGVSLRTYWDLDEICYVLVRSSGHPALSTNVLLPRIPLATERDCRGGQRKASQRYRFNLPLADGYITTPVTTCFVDPHGLPYESFWLCLKGGGSLYAYCFRAYLVDFAMCRPSATKRRNTRGQNAHPNRSSQWGGFRHFNLRKGAAPHLPEHDIL